MRHDVKKVREDFEEKAFQLQKEVEKEALVLYKKNPKKARKYLTQKCNDFMNKLVTAYWKLGDDLWSKYTGKF
jgi:dipeptidase